MIFAIYDNHQSKMSGQVQKSNLVLFIFAFLSLLFGAEKIQAQDNVVLRVIVSSDDDGGPLASSLIRLYNANRQDFENDPDKFCLTNGDGFCEIRGIDPTFPYMLFASYVGHTTVQRTLSFVSDERKIVQIALKVDIQQIADIIIEDQRYLTTGEVGVRRINQMDLSRSPSPSGIGDLTQYLQTLPGIVTTSDRGGELFIRGGTPEQNLILIDKLPVIKPFHISNLFSPFSDEVVNSAEVYAGGYDATYSGVTNAVIDIRLRQGNMKYFESSVSLSPHIASILLEGPVKEDRRSLLFSARTSLIEQTAPLISSSGFPIQFSDVLARYTLTERDISCNVTGLMTIDRGEIVPVRNLEQQWRNFVLGTRCLAFSEDFNYPLDISVGYTFFDNSETSDLRRERYSAISQFYFNTKLQQNVFGSIIDYGFGMQIRRYTINLNEPFVNFLGQTDINTSLPLLNLFIRNQWMPARGLELQAGLVSQISEDTPVTLEPRFRISWSPAFDENLELSASVGRYYQFYTGISDERDIGSVFTIMKPISRGETLPRADHFIIALSRKFTNRIELKLEAYKKIHTQIQVSKWSTVANLETETATVDGETLGLDSQLEFDFGKAYVALNYGYSRVVYSGSGGELGSWNNQALLSYSPSHDLRHKFSMLSTYNVGGFTISTNWKFGTGGPFTQIYGYDFYVNVPFEEPQIDNGTARLLYDSPYSERLPTFHQLDMSIQRTFKVGQSKELRISGGVLNVYNRKNIYNFDINTLTRVDQTPLFPFLSVNLRM